MRIRKTTLNDLEPVMAMYDYARKFMQEHGNPNQWINGYPSEEYIRREIADGHSYICENEQGEMVPNPARLVEEQAILNARTISVDDDGDIRWLLKDVNYSGLLDVLKSLHDEITMLTGVPNMTDEAFANADNASALGYKLYALDQYTASMDR